MFREMRRNKQYLPAEEVTAILDRATSGVLALAGDEGYPYAVPLSFVYTEGRIYFHCAKEGHKLDAVRRSPLASFCVIDQDEIRQDQFTTAYRSVIAFGQIKIMDSPEAIMAAIRLLAQKYSPSLSEAERQTEIDGALAHLCMLELNIEHLTGKEGRVLAQARG